MKKLRSFELRKSAMRQKSGTWLAVLCLAAILLYQTGWLIPVDRTINSMRMDISPRAATGDIVFLAIDKKSLDEVGVWPWPRRLHGEIIQKLNAAGVKDIIFDVDFSARSNAEDDKLFADALKHSKSPVALASFIQNLQIDGDIQEFGANKPLEIFTDHAWLVAVNTIADTDGIVRSFFGVQIIDGEEVPSVPIYISGDNTAQLGANRLLIDFSIQAQDIPKFSLADLLNDTIEAAKIKDKTVLIGAHALELRDDQSVPIYGILSGPVIQILATQTLLQNRTSIVSSAWVPLGMGTLFIAILVIVNRPHRYISQLVALLGIGLVVEAFAVILFDQFAILLATTPLLTLLASLILVRSVYELKNLKWAATKAEREKQNMQKVLSQIVQDSSDAIIVVSEKGDILHLSASAFKIFQIDKNQSDLTAKSILPENVNRQVEAVFYKFNMQNDGAIQHTELCLLSPTGPLILDTTLTPSRLEIEADTRGKNNAYLNVVCLTGRDVTQKRLHEIKLDHLSKHDELTGAMRRKTLIDLVQTKIDKAEPSLEHSALFCFDLHRFKIINDTMGRQVGDQLLKSVLDRVRSVTENLTALSRLGSNTFGFLLHLNGQSAYQIAAMIAQKLRMPFELEGHSAQIGVRIGFAHFQANQYANQWLAKAELALDEAKQAKNGAESVCYLPDMSQKRERARALEREMWQALDEKNFHLAYQPQVRLCDQRIIGAEALLRWSHTHLGDISPAEFIPIAEANGMIEALGRFALEQACIDAAQWPDNIKVAVNVSPIQLMRGDLEDRVHRALSNSHLDANRLQLEVTETSFLRASHELVETLNHLKQAGISLALDDFGTGYSSYGYMAQLPLDKVKIDQMFVRGLLDDKNNRAMIQAMKTLAQEMGLSMICEGIETPAQMRLLISMGCTEGQGYLFGKAMPQDKFMDHLKNHMRLHNDLEDISQKPTNKKLSNLSNIV